MKKIFKKGSSEWQMFKDLYALCQNHYIPEEPEGYWNTALQDAQSFCDSYGNAGLAREFANAYLKYLEGEWKRNGEKDKD